jgi:endonuclease-3
VFRVSRRLGLSRGRNPTEVENDLMERIPREEWILFSHLMIFHGRRVCIARKPRCEACTLFDLCPSGPYYVAGRVPPWDRKIAARSAPAARKKAAKKKAAKKKGKRAPAPAPAKKAATRPIRAAKKKISPRRRSA